MRVTLGGNRGVSRAAAGKCGLAPAPEDAPGVDPRRAAPSCKPATNRLSASIRLRATERIAPLTPQTPVEPHFHT
jgi:hypothetical protein